MIPTEYNPVAWTPEEDATLLKLIQEDELSLRDAARKLRPRTHAAVKNRYYVLVYEGKGKKRQRSVPGYLRPDCPPSRPVFMNPHAEALISRAKAKADKPIEAGTAVDAALNMVAQEYDIRLNPDDFALRPAGEAAHRVLDLLTAEGRRAFMKAGA